MADNETDKHAAPEDEYSGEIADNSIPVKDPDGDNMGVASIGTDSVEAETDKAVDDIVKEEGDEVLQLRDKAAQDVVVMKESMWDRIKNAFAQWWDDPRQRYGTVGFVVVLLGLLLGVPYLRYNMLGLALSSHVNVTVVDSKTGSPVSGATVSAGSVTTKTEANGRAQLQVHMGTRKIAIKKAYYKGTELHKLVGLSDKSNTYKASIDALGRRVQVQVIDRVTGLGVSGATITVGSTTTTTNSKGFTTVVISSDKDKQTASVTLSGYNTAKVQVVASGSKAENTFGLVPAGQLYFLSNLSGKIDVVKTNLDGTARQIVLAGTGSEDPQTTSLLASRDWKYLALLSKREGKAKVYLIDTVNGDKLTTIDEGDANFSLVGWSGSNFVYQVTRTSVSLWQPNRVALKSYNADTSQNLLLDQTQASGTADFDALNQYIGTITLMGDQVVYTKNWQAASGSVAQIPSKQAELHTINANGSGHKLVKSFSLDTSVYGQYGVAANATSSGPTGVYIDFWDGTKNRFYSYEAGKVTELADMTSDKYYSQTYPTYLQSPGGTQTFWAEQRDGKNALFTGTQDGKAPKQIASLSPYNAYGWYTEKYLLVSKGSSELYIMGTSGGDPQKITDYYKPSVNYGGYGGGYGGL